MAVQKLKRMEATVWVAPQDRDGFARDLGVVEEVDRLAQTCIVSTPLPVVEGVASLCSAIPRWNLVNQRASFLCEAARELARGAGGNIE